MICSLRFFHNQPLRPRSNPRCGTCYQSGCDVGFVVISVVYEEQYILPTFRQSLRDLAGELPRGVDGQGICTLPAFAQSHILAVKILSAQPNHRLGNQDAFTAAHPPRLNSRARSFYPASHHSK